jgi:hypothetical protein
MSVSLEETIVKLDEVRKRGILGICGIKISYILKLLRELQERRKQSGIIRCGVCIHYIPMSNNWGKCGVHSSPTEKYRTCQICDYCSWAERRTDE